MPYVAIGKGMLVCWYAVIVFGGSVLHCNCSGRNDVKAKTLVPKVNISSLGLRNPCSHRLKPGVKELIRLRLFQS